MIREFKPTPASGLGWSMVFCVCNLIWITVCGVCKSDFRWHVVRRLHNLPNTRHGILPRGMRRLQKSLPPPLPLVTIYPRYASSTYRIASRTLLRGAGPMWRR